MTYKENITAILECYFTGFKKEIIDSACNRILEQQPCEDCISRQAVDELSKELVHTTRDKADFLCNFWEGLQKLPSVTPKEKTAEWYEEDGCKGACEGYMSAGVICSQCGEVFCSYIGDYNFCPNCGARMVRE